MAMSEERYNEIQDFLDGNFTDAKSAEFQKAISRDEQLASDVAFVRLEREMQDALLDDAFSAQMKEWQKEKDGLPEIPMANLPNKKNSGNRYWLLILLPLLLAGAWWLLKPAPTGNGGNDMPNENQTEAVDPLEKKDPLSPTPESNNTPVKRNQNKPTSQERPIAKSDPSESELSAMIDKHDPKMDYISHGVRGGSEKLLSEAESAWKADRYDDAIAIYKEVASEKSERGIESAMNIGLLYFNQDKYTEAVPYFERMSENVYSDVAQYYIALCHVANRNFSEAINLIEGLIKKDGFVTDADKKKAEFLKEKLESFK